MDVINLISKDQRFPDAEVVLGEDHDYHPGGKYYVNGPRLHEYLREMYTEVLCKYDTVTVGEMPGVSDIDEIIRTVGSNSKELNMIFIFDIVDIDNEPGKVRFTLHPFSVHDIRRITNKWQRAMIDKDGWNSVFVENHDNPRSVSRYCDDSDEWRVKGAKLLALMQATLAGTLFVYQGEELGMRNVPVEWDIDTEYKDIEGINFWKKTKALYGDGKDPEKFALGRRILEKKARDHARTPVQWDAGPNAGFCEDGVKPWMRVNDDWKEINAERQMSKEKDAEEMSVWHFWQRVLASRKMHKDVFVYGDYKSVGDDRAEVFAYLRTGKDSGRGLVVLNFSGKEVEWDIPAGMEVQVWVAGNYSNGRVEKEGKGRIMLRPWEGILGRC